MKTPRGPSFTGQILRFAQDDRVSVQGVAFHVLVPYHKLQYHTLQVI